MKKILALVISMSFVFGLVGCGNGSGQNSKSSEDVKQESTKVENTDDKTTDVQKETAGETVAGFDISNMPEGGYTVALCNFSLGNT